MAAPNKDVALHIRVESETYKALARIANAQGVKISAVARQAIERHVKLHKGSK